MAKPVQNRNVPATKAPAGAVAEQMPDFMKGAGGKGTEGVRSSDVALPLIKLTQAISLEDKARIQGLKDGDFFHTITDENLGNSLRGTMVYCDVRAILWRPRESGGGILARSEDLKTWSPPNAVFDVQLKGGKQVKWATKGSVVESGLLEFGSADPTDPQSQPAGTRMYNLVFMLPDFEHLSPSIITCQRSAIGPAKKFLGKLKMSRAPSFGQRYKIQSVLDQGPSGPFFNYQFTADGFVTDETEYKFYEEFYEKFAAEGVRIKDEDLESSAATQGAAEGAGSGQAPSDRPKY